MVGPKSVCFGCCCGSVFWCSVFVFLFLSAEPCRKTEGFPEKSSRRCRVVVPEDGEIGCCGKVVGKTPSTEYPGSYRKPGSRYRERPLPKLVPSPGCPEERV